MITKTSIGIIIVKFNTKTNCPEVLLVHKRYTYAFNEFISGNYVLKSPNSPYSIESLLEQMTTDELLDIWSLNFEQIWFRLCLNVNKQDIFYNKKYIKFQSAFMQDGGKYLKKLIENIRNKGTLLWEVPKGRKNNNKESDLSCALREVEEETGIKKHQYNLIPNVSRKISFISYGVRYVCIYFIAIAIQNLYNLQFPNLKNIDKLQEVLEIRWFDIHYLRLFDNGKKRLESLIIPAFNLAKKYIRGKYIYHPNDEIY